MNLDENNESISQNNQTGNLTRDLLTFRADLSHLTKSSRYCKIRQDNSRRKTIVLYSLTQAFYFEILYCYPNRTFSALCRVQCVQQRTQMLRQHWASVRRRLFISSSSGRNANPNRNELLWIHEAIAASTPRIIYANTGPIPPPTTPITLHINTHFCSVRVLCWYWLSLFKEIGNWNIFRAYCILNIIHKICFSRKIIYHSYFSNVWLLPFHEKTTERILIKVDNIIQNISINFITMLV